MSLDSENHVYGRINGDDIIGLVDHIITQAIESGVSDIHFEPIGKGLRVRYRVDGLLHEKERFALEHSEQLIARIKIIAHIDVAERRIPQDGKYRMSYKDRCIDLRVSTFPTVYGEKVVIRILDTAVSRKELAELGFSETMLQTFSSVIHHNEGFVLVTGPTGSGKTTTLYSIISTLNVPHKHIVTIENPVEYSIDGIVQSQIHAAIGFTFKNSMKALVRQDPDIIMVGEMRDKESACLAFEAALTGHFVLSSLHTKGAPDVLVRLIDMGVQSFMINAALTAVLAQRLLRRICDACKKEQALTDQEKLLCDQLHIMPSVSYRGTGCERCLYTGYKGRVGVFQLMIMSEEMRSLMMKQPTIEEMYQQAFRDGMESLMHDAVTKVLSGLISFNELARLL
ncbi:MAG: GspE/PulE family protein [Candidatus Babeliales bacterium]